MKKNNLNKIFDSVGLGELLIDFTPINKGEYLENPGGAVSNVCSVFANHKMKSALISKVGNDYFGKYLKCYLEDIGVDCHSIVIDKEHNTTLAFVSLDSKGEREFTFFRNNSADVNLKKEDIDPLVITNSKIFHFGSLSLVNDSYKEATIYGLKVAKENGLMITFDPNYRKTIWTEEEFKEAVSDVLNYVDIIKVSKEEGEILTGFKNLNEISNSLLEKVEMVIITMGENGSYFANKFCSSKIMPFKAKTIDTTGAGDIFFGTFLCELVKSDFDFSKDNLIKILTNASKIAALSTEVKGAIPSIPIYNEN